MKTCLQFMIELHHVCCFQTTEGAKVGPASNSELRRWFQQRCVEVNGVPVKHDDQLPRIDTLVLFPKNSRKRCTLFWDPPTLIEVDEGLLNVIKMSTT